MDRIFREERNYILGMVKKIKANRCNVLLIKKNILRDVVTDLSLHYLVKVKILVVKDVERDEIEFITKTLNCLPIANIKHFREEKLWFADCVEEVSIVEGKIVKISGNKDIGRTMTVLVRRSNQLVIDEVERSLHDALCVVRCLVNKKFLIAGLQDSNTKMDYQTCLAMSCWGLQDQYFHRENIEALLQVHSGTAGTVAVVVALLMCCCCGCCCATADADNVVLRCCAAMYVAAIIKGWLLLYCCKTEKEEGKRKDQLRKVMKA